MNITFLFKNKNLRPFLLSGLIATLTALIIIGVASWLFYKQTSEILETNLRERLLSIVKTGAVQFDPKDIEQLEVEQDWQKPAWTRVVNTMEKIRMNNTDIIFVYLFRKSKTDPAKMEFVADSHSINPYANVDDDPTNNLDLDGNGIIDEGDQLQWPGQKYPTAPKEAFDAYSGSTTSQLYSDQWGPVLTGYVPIKNENNNVVAIFAVDIRADDFTVITRQTLFPFIIFCLILAAIITLLSASLVQIGKSKIYLLQAIDQQKNQVISTVAHQLNTPITTVRWAVELARDGSQPINESLTQIEGGINELRDLSEMFLQASRIQSGKLEISNAPVQLDKFFKELLNDMAALAQNKKIKIKSSVPSNLPTIMIDAKYLRITIENLLTNAIKYTAGNGKISLKVKIINKTMNCVVSDNGIGIPRKDKDKIFGQMYRASNVTNYTKNRIEGNGLGLYAAKGAAEAQGGKIWFESEGVEGKGTTFYVTLPITIAKTKKSDVDGNSAA